MKVLYHIGNEENESTIVKKGNNRSCFSVFLCKS